MDFRMNLKVEEADSFENFAHVYQTTRYNMPEDCNLNTRHREKLISFENLAKLFSEQTAKCGSRESGTEA
jgi:hypothetical protein